MRRPNLNITVQTWVGLIGADIAGRGAEGLELGDAEPLVDGGEVPVLVDDDLVVGAAEEAEGLVPRPLRLPRGGFLLGEPSDVLACGKEVELARCLSVISHRKYSALKFCSPFCRKESQKERNHFQSKSGSLLPVLASHRLRLCLGPSPCLTAYTSQVARVEPRGENAMKEVVAADGGSETDGFGTVHI